MPRLSQNERAIRKELDEMDEFEEQREHEEARQNELG